jgi:uncharacterized membrane protein YeiH
MVILLLMVPILCWSGGGSAPDVFNSQWGTIARKKIATTCCFAATTIMNERQFAAVVRSFRSLSLDLYALAETGRLKSVRFKDANLEERTSHEASPDRARARPGESVQTFVF